MAKLILIRHGQSRHNELKIVQGSDPDPTNTLNALGRRQAQAYGRMLLKRGIKPAGVWSSPLPRACETAEIVLKVLGCRLPIRPDDRLKEMSKGRRGQPGGMEGLPSLEARTPEYREMARRGGWTFRYGSRVSGGETPKEAGRRSAAALRDIARSLQDDETGLVFAHGHCLRYGLGTLLSVSSIERVNTEFRLGNCESFEVSTDAQARRWRLEGCLAA